MRTISYADFFKGGESGSLRYVAIARLLPYTDCNSDHDDYNRQEDRSQVHDLFLHYVHGGGVVLMTLYP
jgi:hypothetical protein